MAGNSSPLTISELKVKAKTNGNILRNLDERYEFG